MPLHDNTSLDVPLKHCSQCKNEFPATVEYFGKDRQRPSGLASACRSCERERARRYRAEHPDRTRKAGQKYYAANREARAEYRRQYAEANPGKATEAARKSRANNRERAREVSRAWAAANPDKIKESQRKFYRANPEKSRAAVLRRRAIKRAANGDHTAADIRRQYEAQKGKCYYCGCDLGDSYHTDHVIPLSRGGSDGPENIVVACGPCNLAKGARLPSEWAGRDDAK